MTLKDFQGVKALRKIHHQFGFLEYIIKGGDVIEILEIEVNRNHRMKGYGRKLIEDLLRTEKVDEKGLTVQVTTRNSNAAAKIFYKAVGFNYGFWLHNFYSGYSAFLFYRTPQR